MSRHPPGTPRTGNGTCRLTLAGINRYAPNRRRAPMRGRAMAKNGTGWPGSA
jgi:hypothetical protein